MGRARVRGVVLAAFPDLVKQEGAGVIGAAMQAVANAPWPRAADCDKVTTVEAFFTDSLRKPLAKRRASYIEGERRRLARIVAVQPRGSRRGERGLPS